MQFRSLSILLMFCAVPAFAANDTGVVHEWGTFTSVADANGMAVNWLPLSGPLDLPCFVHRLAQSNPKAAYGTVRMETPVLYFYPLKPSSVSVHVDFPTGRVSEWYPQANSVQTQFSARGWIEWKDVQVSPRAEPFPEGPANHYYAARATDAWPLTSGGENEKFLFYRGIGYFNVDIRPVVHADGVTVGNAGTEPVPIAILFENQGGNIRYRALRNLRDPVTVKFSDLNGGLELLRGQLEDDLTEMGLYRKEAHAMLETWRDSWFEEGMRVMYILPRTTVDTLLPISIAPAPSQLSRVFVGRVELLAPWMKEEIAKAAASGDVKPIEKYGRFLDAFLERTTSAGERLTLAISRNRTASPNPCR